MIAIMYCAMYCTDALHWQAQGTLTESGLTRLAKLLVLGALQLPLGEDLLKGPGQKDILRVGGPSRHDD